MELLKFIFSSFWIFAGFVILLSLITNLINTVVSNILRVILFAIKQKNNKS